MKVRQRMQRLGKRIAKELDRFNSGLYGGYYQSGQLEELYNTNTPKEATEKRKRRLINKRLGITKKEYLDIINKKTASLKDTARFPFPTTALSASGSWGRPMGHRTSQAWEPPPWLVSV